MKGLNCTNDTKSCNPSDLFIVMLFAWLPYRLILVYNSTSLISKMSSSKQKDSITNWFKKSKTENNKKIEEEPLPTLPEIEWYAIF